MMTPERKKWIVLLSHGSRDERWREPFVRLKERLCTLEPGLAVTLAFLQFCSPTLEEALEDCRRQGARQILVAPIFFSGGGHMLLDIPRVIARAVESYPDLSITSVGAIGEEAEVIEAMAAACLRQHHSREKVKG
jgi:sirohydrochlorin cobaltochelatase